MAIKREFSSTEEVFAALPEPLREHSLRVEKYADLIFMELCAAEEYTINIHSRVRLRSDNRSLVGLAARYHDFGKVLVPEYYQMRRSDYTPEEYALYCRHNLAGDELVHGIYAEQKGVVPMTVDVICESILYHHENWDGSGFPKGLTEEHIPIVGRIVAVADAMDHQLMKTKTETPVQTVIENMMMDSGSVYDPVIMGLLYEARPKVERIFAQYRNASQAIPVAPRVIKRKKRPLWLEYRPIFDLRRKRVRGVEADMRFKLGKETVLYADAEPLLKKTKQTFEAGYSFVIEACDTARRMKTCGVGGSFVALNVAPGFLKKRGAATTVIKMLADTESDPGALALIVSAEEFSEPTPTVCENCQKLRAAGCHIVCRGVHLEGLSTADIKRLAGDYVFIDAAEFVADEKLEGHLKRLDDEGITVIGDNVDRNKLAAILLQNGVLIGVGDVAGEYMTEDDFILGELAVTE